MYCLKAVGVFRSVHARPKDAAILVDPGSLLTNRPTQSLLHLLADIDLYTSGKAAFRPSISAKNFMVVPTQTHTHVHACIYAHLHMNTHNRARI